MTTPDYEGDQLKFLRRLLQQERVLLASRGEAAAAEPDLLAMDRKARNKLEKRLRRTLGLPKTDPPQDKQQSAEGEQQAEGGDSSEAAAAAAQEAAERKKAKKAAKAALKAEAAAKAAPAAATKQEQNGGAAKMETEEEAADAGAGASASRSSKSKALDDAVAKAVLKDEKRAARAEEAARAEASRSRKKAREARERYKLPPELHIPQELLLAYPVENARRVEREAKLWKYERNHPLYAEKVAKVRKEFLDSLPAHIGAGSASGADGNKASVTSGWDRNVKLVAEFRDGDAVDEMVVPASKRNTAASAATAAATEEPAAKKHKSGAGAAVAASSSDSATAVVPLHESYQPRFVSSFTWLPEQSHLRKSDIDPLSAEDVLAYTASRMVRPGAPYPYARPQLPLVFRPNNKGYEVDKPGVVALIMAARTAGVVFEEPSQPAATPAADEPMQPAEAEEKPRKQKKRKHAQQDASDSSSSAGAAAAASSSPAAAAASASSSGPILASDGQRIRFASYRNNFRKFFARRDFWRVDVQRVGRTIFLRRHLNYNFVNPFDVGHLFEQACKESNVRAAAKAAERMAAAGLASGYVNRVKVEQSSQTQVAAEDSTTHPYRAIVEAQLREFDLLTSIEIDLYKKYEGEDAANGAAAAASSSAAASAAPAPSAASTLAPAPSFPPDRLSSFLELKTVGKHRWDKVKKADVWVQTFLGGVPRTIVGFKDVHREPTSRELKSQRKKERKAAHEAGVAYAYDEQSKAKVSKRANQKAELVASKLAETNPPVAITDVQEQDTRFLIDAASKEQLMKRFYNVLRFMAKHVKEGRVYKLEHRKRTGAQTQPAQLGSESAAHAANWGIFLEEIEGGIAAQPVLVPGMLARVDAWAEQIGLQQQETERLAEASPSAAATEDKEAKKSKKKSSKKKSSSSSSSSAGEDSKSSKKKSSKKTKKEKKAEGAVKREGEEADAEMTDAAATDGQATDKKKTKKSTKKKDKSATDKKKKEKKSSKKKVKSEAAPAAASAAASDSDSD